MKPLPIFIGFDHRQPVAFATLAQSLMKTTKRPISIIPLLAHTLPVKRQGLTPFTFTRFLVPWLCDYEGWALFMDIDMMARADVSDLFKFCDERYAARVVKNERRFEWASLILFNCPRCKILTPEYIENAQGLHKISWLGDVEIGELPAIWNHLAGYDAPNDGAQVVHFTQGIPAFPQTVAVEHGEEWRAMAQETFSSAPWEVLMGHSVHAKHVLGGTK